MIDFAKLHEAHTQVQDILDALVIREGSLTLVAQQDGDIPIEGNHGYGLYHRDCRFLSGYALRINGHKPTIILSNDEKGYACVTMLTNPEFRDMNDNVIGRETISIRRDRIIPGVLDENIIIYNFNEFDILFELTLELYSDFDDIFTVRGMAEKTDGKIYPPEYDGKLMTLMYEGKDGHRRNTIAEFNPDPTKVDGYKAVYSLGMKPHEKRLINVRIAAEDMPPEKPVRPDKIPIDRMIKGMKASYMATMECCSNVQTDNHIFNRVFLRSLSDLRMLYMGMPDDIFYSAGVPWYDALFGRDSIISAMQVIPYNPEVARSTLRLHARYQGRKIDKWKDEQPGKILHELRVGEHANLNLVPQTPYYGSVDSTPLFLILMAEYVDWTGDMGIFNELIKNVEAAIEWMDRYGIFEGSDFLCYSTMSPKGLYNQGWKDSWDSISHSDGDLAVHPIALAEVQGYAYMAKRRIARLYERIDRGDEAKKLMADAANLRWRFNERFWMTSKKYYAQALDARGTCDVISSNGAQALWSEIIDRDKAAYVVNRIFERDMFTGWGIRTLSSNEVRYNPLGYHNGTVWPHDNSLIAMGLGKYGFKDEMAALFSSMFEAAGSYPRYRLPELFSGFQREEYDIPIKYPVACSPQAWSSGSIPYMLTASLGFIPDALNRRLTLVKPNLPPWLHTLKINKLIVGDAYTQLEFQRVGESTMVNVVGKRGDLEVRVEY